MNRVYVILCSKLPNEIGYLEIIKMNEEQIQRLPHEVFTPLNSRTNGMQISKGCFLAPSSLSASSNSSPKVTRLRATFFDTFPAKMGHFLGHY